jgi:putative SOS response-associated peptidase YedK
MFALPIKNKFMCYNYDIMQKKLDREFPDLTGTLYDPAEMDDRLNLQGFQNLEGLGRTLYDPAEMDDNPFHSAFTFRKGPVIIRGEVNELHYYHWGLIHKWTKSLEDAKKIRTQTLNARSETVFEKPSFRASISKKRCLIPACGFYEGGILMARNILIISISKTANYFLLRVSMRAGLTARRANCSIPIPYLPWMPTP